MSGATGSGLLTAALESKPDQWKALFDLAVAVETSETLASSMCTGFDERARARDPWKLEKKIVEHWNPKQSSHDRVAMLCRVVAAFAAKSVGFPTGLSTAEDKNWIGDLLLLALQQDNDNCKCNSVIAIGNAVTVSPGASARKTYMSSTEIFWVRPPIDNTFANDRI